MKKILLFIPLLISCIAVKGQWNGATPIVTTSNTTAKTAPVAINDGNGNMIIAWVDARNSATTGTDIYIQKINKDGTLPWGAEKIVCNAAEGQSNVSLTSDGAGGAILVWDDNRNSATTGTDIYGQRVNASGNILWAANGVIIANGDDTQTSAILSMINATEAVIVWRDSRRLVPKPSNPTEFVRDQDPFANKILISDGSKQWGANDIQLSDALGTQTELAILPDGNNGIFIVWTDPSGTPTLTSDRDIFGQRLNNSGTKLWATSSTIGLPLISVAGIQQTASIALDGAGGLVAVFSDARSGTNGGSDIYAQRFDSNGAKVWVNDVKVVDAIGFQSNPYVVNSNNEFVCIWSDPRATNRNIYAQKLDLSGTLKWTPSGGTALDGIAICTATGNQPTSSTFSGVVLQGDGLGGAFIVWDDARGTDNGVYSQYINTTGAIQFAANGLLVSDATGNQRTPVIIADGSGGFITAWTDSRTSTNGEIYAARISSTGTLPVTYTSFTATKNTLNEVSLVWNIASEINTDEYLIERKGETGDFITIGSLKAQQLNTYSFTDKNPLLGNNYYRIKAKDFDATLSYSDVKTVQIDALNSDAISVYPNPTSDRLNITINKAGNYQIKFVDQSGRVVLEKAIELNSGLNDLGVSLSSFSAGTYYLTLTNQLNYIAKKIIKI
ncbi:T9SS type A sorting domain-containing protein [Pedobacter glucosidilyticus]|uniref:T9SS type A sorting domain-containing protein n=1 Tax=Pedobacter glucosidilyticus TaxID=1122941 RepID=UPI0026F1C02C|nr:T9SS type A sorting domain-containing protein [Pedobacter glucosidilyticus]